MDVEHVNEHDVRGRGVRFDHQFVEGAPKTLDPGVLYVSIRHKNVLHLCACGCGFEVVTPLAPHRWQLFFDGETVSLEPSVGNSSLPCRSHYFITNSEVDWHRPMTDKGIAWARKRDQLAVEGAFGSAEAPTEADGMAPETVGPGAALSATNGDHTDESLAAGSAIPDDRAALQGTCRMRLGRRVRSWVSRSHAS